MSELVHQTYVVARKVVIAWRYRHPYWHRHDCVAWSRLIVLPTGLAILAIEFAWARRWLKKVKQMAQEAMDKMHHNSPQHPSNQAPPHCAISTATESAPNT